jgi:inner membrane protein
VLDSVLHFTGAQGLIPSTPVTSDFVAQKAIYYGCTVVGALTPDIDNARSTIGKRAGIVSKGIQHLAGHRTLFHSLLGLALVGGGIWGAQYLVGLLFVHLGLVQTAAALGVVGAHTTQLRASAGLAFKAFLVGYFLHLCADSLTEGGVPWLWPNHMRFGFPPNRRWRFRSGSPVEPFVVLGVCALTMLYLYVRGHNSPAAVSSSARTLVRGTLGTLLLAVVALGVAAFAVGLSLSVRASIAARSRRGTHGRRSTRAANPRPHGTRASVEQLTLLIAIAALIASTVLGMLQLAVR